MMPNTAKTPVFPLKTTLADDTPVLIRPLKPDDKHLLKTGLQLLSDQDRYFRFFQPMPRLPETMLRRFTEIDHANHEAIGALDLSDASNSPAGVARYVRSEVEKHAAEIAVTVVGIHKGKGLGTLLMTFLAMRALENGIDVFEAMVSGDNRRMLEFLDRFDPVEKTQMEDAICVRIPLYKEAHRYPMAGTAQALDRITVSARKSA